MFDCIRCCSFYKRVTFYYCYCGMWTSKISNGGAERTKNKYIYKNK